MNRKIYDEIEIIEEPDIPNKIKIEMWKTWNSKHDYIGYIIKQEHNGIFYKTPHRTDFKLICQYPIKIEKMIKIENRVLYKISIDGRKYKYADLSDITTLFKQYIYNDKLGKRLIREYLYTISLIYFPELLNCFFG